MNKYPKYKPSGIDWIGEIPEHWGLATVGRLNDLGRGRVISALEIGMNSGDYPVYSSQTENNGIMGYLNTYDFEGEYVTWTTDGANAGTVFYRESKFNCTNVCGTIQPKNWGKIDLKFLPYFLNLGTKFSVRLDINPKLMNNMMAKIPLVIPPKPEQTSIANFLDEKISQIEKLITNKQKLIELLKEERTAIINQAVTRGIDPNVKLKPSGVDWLGDIPEHWEVKKLKYVAKIVLGKMLTNEDKGDYFLKLYLRAANLQWLNVDVSDVKEMWFSKDELDKLRLKKFDLLVSEGGEVGRTCIWREELVECYIQNSVHKITIEESYNPFFFLYQFFYLGSIGYFESIVNRISIAHLTGDKIREIFVWFPDGDEQNQIIEYIETETKRINCTISKIEKEIELLQEYRNALISEVVTGKMKVI